MKPMELADWAMASVAMAVAVALWGAIGMVLVKLFCTLFRKKEDRT